MQISGARSLSLDSLLFMRPGGQPGERQQPDGWAAVGERLAGCLAWLVARGGLHRSEGEFWVFSFPYLNKCAKVCSVGLTLVVEYRQHKTRERSQAANQKERSHVL